MLNSSYFVSPERPWFSSHWPEEVPKNLEFSEKTVDTLIRDAAHRWPNRSAVWFLGSRFSYRELDRDIDCFATALFEMGLKKGETIALLLPNSYQYMVAYHAALRIGAIVSGVNPTYKPLEIKHQLESVHAKALIFLDILYKEKVAPIRNDIKLRFLIGTNLGDFLPWPKKRLGMLLKKLPMAPLPHEALSFAELVRTRPNPPVVPINPLEDPAVYIMTGGTTGVPKAAVLTHFNVLSNALQVRAWFYKAHPGISSLAVIPFFHAFGMTAIMNVTSTWGGQVVIFPKPPSPEELCQTIQKVGIADHEMLYIGAEVLFQRLLDFPDLEKYGVEKKFLFCVSGAGPLHTHVQMGFEKRTGVPLIEGYGLTEASPIVSANLLYGTDEMRRSGTIGFPMPGTDWRIVDRTDPQRDLGIGDGPEDKDHIGELAVCGPQVMVGYLDNPAETEAHFFEADGRRWLLTGDIGFMNAAGNVTILDRKKELIKVKGFSVFPKDVENLLGRHPAISEVAVAGLPDSKSIELIKAWVVLKAEFVGKVTEEELLAWSKENMTHYKVPRFIEFRESIPKNLVGKVLRRELREHDPLWPHE